MLGTQALYGMRHPAREEPQLSVSAVHCDQYLDKKQDNPCGIAAQRCHLSRPCW